MRGRWGVALCRRRLLPASGRKQRRSRQQGAQPADVTTSLPAGSLGLPPAGVKSSW
jgi:hypothetical protein